MPKHFANEFPHDETCFRFSTLLSISLTWLSLHSAEKHSHQQGCKNAFCERLKVTIERLHFHIQSSSTPDLVSVCIRSACKMVEWIMMVQFHSWNDSKQEGMKKTRNMLEKSNVHFFPAIFSITIRSRSSCKINYRQQRKNRTQKRDAIHNLN